jgi:hypothetical protein
MHSRASKKNAAAYPTIHRFIQRVSSGTLRAGAFRKRDPGVPCRQAPGKSQGAHASGDSIRALSYIALAKGGINSSNIFQKFSNCAFRAKGSIFSGLADPGNAAMENKEQQCRR